MKPSTSMPRLRRARLAALALVAGMGAVVPAVAAEALPAAAGEPAGASVVSGRGVVVIVTGAAPVG